MELLSLFLSIVAIVISVVSVVRTSRGKMSNIGSNNNIDIEMVDLIVNTIRENKEVRDVIVNTVTRSQRIGLFINKKMFETNKTAKKHPIPQVNYDELKNEITEDVIVSLKPVIQKMIDESMVLVKKDNPPQIEESQLVLRKYGFYKKDSFAVSDTPTDSTIFVFSINPKDISKALFEVYDAQVEKVVEDKNYLEGCCSIEGDGNHIQTIEEGQVMFEEGQWKLVKKLKIKFN